jgi:hypothetical protein
VKEDGVWPPVESQSYSGLIRQMSLQGTACQRTNRSLDFPAFAHDFTNVQSLLFPQSCNDQVTLLYLSSLFTILKIPDPGAE